MAVWFYFVAFSSPGSGFVVSKEDTNVAREVMYLHVMHPVLTFSVNALT